jgi:hypothetical protein
VFKKFGAGKKFKAKKFKRKINYQKIIFKRNGRQQYLSDWIDQSL